MPVITVALFALAGVVLAVAIVIQQMAGGGDDDGTSPADQVSANATNTVLAATAAATSGGGGATTPGAGTATVARTPGAGTPVATTAPGTTPGASVKTHTVLAGEFCGTIADNAGISLDEFFALNPGINNPSCSNLAIGQVVNIAR